MGLQLIKPAKVMLFHTGADSPVRGVLLGPAEVDSQDRRDAARHKHRIAAFCRSPKPDQVMKDALADTFRSHRLRMKPVWGTV
jgi:hypothetical protein